MMNVDIRSFIVNNFKDDSSDSIRDSIDKVVSSRDEEPLIGLGVLLEMLWNQSSIEEKMDIAKRIRQGISSYS